MVRPGISSAITGVRDGALSALLVRVERAEGPDAVIDLDLWCATADRHKLTITQAPFTASLDAALALCERALGSVMWSIGNTGDDGGDAAYEADLYAKSGQPDWEVHTYGPTPALALIAAMLRVLIEANADTTERSDPLREDH